MSWGDVPGRHLNDDVLAEEAERLMIWAGSASTALQAKGSALTLATGSFTVAGGKTATVKLHLSAKARKLLAHSHTLRASATIRRPAVASSCNPGQRENWSFGCRLEQNAATKT
ncbi:MAG TPA: hypothetical protein VIJ39_14480 [Solirubrobacteraceae bacterium]